MSSAGRAANSSGCVARPKEHATGLIGFAAQIRRSSLIGSCAMEAAEHREPCESRGSCMDLGAPGGEIPPGDSTAQSLRVERQRAQPLAGGRKDRIADCGGERRNPRFAYAGRVGLRGYDVDLDLRHFRDVRRLIVIEIALLDYAVG